MDDKENIVISFRISTPYTLNDSILNSIIMCMRDILQTINNTDDTSIRIRNNAILKAQSELDQLYIDLGEV